MGNSQLLGVHVPGCPLSLRLWQQHQHHRRHHHHHHCPLHISSTSVCTTSTSGCTTSTSVCTTSTNVCTTSTSVCTTSNKWFYHLFLQCSLKLLTLEIAQR